MGSSVNAVGGTYLVATLTGQIVHQGNTPIMETEGCSKIISYRSSAITVNKVFDREWIHIHRGNCKATLHFNRITSMEESVGSFQVVGPDPVTVNEMVEEIWHFLGAVDWNWNDIDRKPEFSLPDFSSPWKRIKFIWNYIIYGKVA